MAILLRTQWTRLKDIPGPDPAQENPLTRYTWLMFDSLTPGNDKLTEAARRAVFEIVRLREKLEPDFSFGQFCRSEMAIETLWAKPTYQLTHSWIHKTDEDPAGKPLPEWSLKFMAKQGFVKWDGATPATIQDKVEQVTKKMSWQDGVACRYFRGPSLLQVNLQPVEGCEKSLDDLFQFSAFKWRSGKREARGGIEQAYVLRAAVKHRQGPDESDSIKLFGKDGAEEVPPMATDLKMPDWRFTPAEAIPAGITLSLFYETVSCISPGIKIQACNPAEGEASPQRRTRAEGSGGNRYGDEDTEGDDQSETPAMDQPLRSLVRATSPIPIGSTPGTWPVDGFADDDSAAVHVMDIMRRYHNRWQPPLTRDDVIIIPNPEWGASDARRYQEVEIRLGLEMTYEAYCNFLFPQPDSPENMMGKARCSPVGLSIIIQALRSIVCDIEERTPISLQSQVDRLIESNGAISYIRPLEDSQVHFVLVEPFELEGIRSTLAALQAAARQATAGCVIFYAHRVDAAIRGGKMCALLDIHPITTGWW